jgi:hypothetical protein
MCRLASSEVCEHELGLLEVNVACRPSTPDVRLEDPRETDSMRAPGTVGCSAARYASRPSTPSPGIGGVHYERVNQQRVDLSGHACGERHTSYPLRSE